MFRFFFLLCGLSLAGHGLVDAKEEADITGKKAAKPFFALKLVHPEADELMKAIDANKALIPEGYTTVPMPITVRETGEVIGQKDFLVRVDHIISGDDILWVGPSPNPGEVMVRLNQEGGKALEKATRKMELGQDRIAAVFENRCLMAPTVQAILTDSFVVAGLADQAAVDHFVKTLSPDAKK